MTIGLVTEADTLSGGGSACLAADSWASTATGRVPRGGVVVLEELGQGRILLGRVWSGLVDHEALVRAA